MRPAAVFGAGLLVAAGTASAQTSPPAPPAADKADAIAQPLLTGHRRPAAAQDVPAFLWWASPADRDATGPDTLADALRAAPGLWAAPAPGDGTRLLAVRHGRVLPGLLLSGAPLPSTTALPLFDLDLVLGDGVTALADGAPGAGGAAGTLSLDLRRPGDALAGMGEFAAGGFGSRRALGRLDLPAAPGIRIGLAGVLHHDLGTLFNSSTGERLNRQQRGGIAGMLDIDVTPQLAWRATLATVRNQAGNLPGFTCDPGDPERCDGRFASTGQILASTGLPTARWGPIGADLAGQPLGQRADLTLFASALAWDVGAVTLSLDQSLARQTGQRGLDLADGRRLDALAVPAGLDSGGYGLIARSRDSVERHQLSADMTLGPLALRAGAAVQRETRWRRQADTEAGTVLADRALEQRHEERSLFASARLKPVAGLELMAGVKMAGNDLSISVDDRRGGCAPCLQPAGSARQSRQLATPEFAIGWRPGGAGALLLFARSARTARLPGWNLLARETADLTALPAETGWHHEAGAKADLAGGRLRINAAAFTASTRSAVPAMLDVDPLAAIVPADMTARGLDLAVVARPVAALELAGTLAVQRVRWQGVVPAGAPSRPLFAPDATASLAASWRQTLPGTGANLVPRIGVQWRSEMAVAAGDVLSADGAGLLAGGIAPGGWQVNAALQMEIPDGGWLMSLECRNCLDRALVDGAVAGLPVLNTPRWWQLRFTRRF
ncbi:MAG: TonB-dependent receptor [Sandarakinorhabdus sp.]|nr:TonB-dependent receptor [Sandarakinorhabdus sp.]